MTTLCLLSAAAPPADGPGWLIWAIGAGVLVVTLAFAFLGRLAMRDGAPRTPAPDAFMSEIELKPVKSDTELMAELRAFAALAKKLRLNRTQRLILRRVAQASRTPAPAMILSQRAYDSAVEFILSDRKITPDSAESREFARLRSRLFAE